MEGLLCGMPQGPSLDKIAWCCSQASMQGRQGAEILWQRALGGRKVWFRLCRKSFPNSASRRHLQTLGVRRKSRGSVASNLNDALASPSGDKAFDDSEGIVKPSSVLGQSKEEFLADVEAGRQILRGILAGAQRSRVAVAELYGDAGLWTRHAVEAVLLPVQAVLSSEWNNAEKWKDVRAWGPLRWMMALGAAAAAGLLIAAAGRQMLLQGEGGKKPGTLAAVSPDPRTLIQELDPIDRARIFRLKHQLAEKRAVGEELRHRLLSSEGLLEGAEGAGAGSSSSGGSAAAAGREAEFWVSRQWWKYRPHMPYTWLLDRIHNYEVSSAVFSTDLRRLYVRVKGGFPSDFTVDVPVDPHLVGELRSRGVALGMVPRSPLFFLRGLAVLAPPLLLLFAIGALQTRMQELMDERVYDLMKMDRFQLILPEDTPPQGGQTGGDGTGGGSMQGAYADVVMGAEIWQVLEEIMTYMRDPMKYHSQGVMLPRGILISGPPGTGKTLLARTMARQCGLPFVFASGAEFVDSTSESGQEKVFNIFFTARANAPSFLFVDEIDALAGKSVVRDPGRRAVYEEFLKELDGDVTHTDVDRFSRRQAVILIAATNRPHELHEGLLAAGRIDREIHIGLPTEEQRVDIFRVHSRSRVLAPSVDFSKLAFRTVGFSGADIRNLVNESSIMAVRRGHTAIDQEDIVAALDKQLYESLGVSVTDEEQRRTYAKVPVEVRRLLAVHEAGHVLLAHLFPSFDWHAFTDILPAGQERALTVFYPRQSMLFRGYTTEGYLRMQMVVAHGGRCAERLVFGDEQLTDAGQDDLIKLSRIARELACSAANPRLGILPITMHPVLEPPALPGETKLIPDTWTRPGTQVADMSVELSEVFTREVTRYLEGTESMALEALRGNIHILHRLADHLFDNFRISGLDAEILVESMQPRRLPDLLDGEDDISIGAEGTIPQLDPERPGRYHHLEIYQAPLHRC